MEKHASQILASVILFLSIFSPASSSISRCPIDDDDLAGPCECLDPFGQVFFVCNGIKSHLQIQSSMKSMAGRHISEFVLRDSNLRYIPYNVFTNTSLHRIKIFKTNLFYLFDRPLEGDVEDSLQEVILEDVSFDGGLDWNVLESLKQLQLFSLQRVDISQIPPTVRKLYLPIETLVVSNASLMFIYDRAFRKFGNLRNLKLDQNELKSFNRSLLPYPVTKLRHLDLRHLQYTCSATESKHGLVSVLEEASCYRFRHKPPLAELPVETPSLAEENLRYLQRKNYLLLLCQLKHTKLLVLYNKFSVLPMDMFDGTPELNSLVLRGNYFYTLQEDFMSKVWNQLFYFDIADNPLNCDCYIRWIVKSERPIHLFGNCASTSSIKDKSLVNLEEEDFVHCS